MLRNRNICQLALLISLSYPALSQSLQTCPAQQHASTGTHVSADLHKDSESDHAKRPESPLARPLYSSGPEQGLDHPISMLDALKARLQTPITLVVVHAIPSNSELAEPFRAGGQEIVSAAGSYGDIERFLQVLPGVTSTSDLSNEILVRGGHPIENLFLVDGIEIPNINHLALSDSTGGFGSMIDSAAVQGVTFFTGGYDAHFPERLSSVVSIETLDPENLTSHGEADFGIQGMGGLLEKQFRDDDLLASVHKGFLQYFDTGEISGLPAYQNELIRYRRTTSSGTRFNILHLAGMDSAKADPCPMDRFSTTTINSQYGGWRETTGLEWQQVYTNRAFGVATISDSEQIERVSQQEQLPDPTKPPSYTGDCLHFVSSVSPIPVYSQKSNEAFSSAGYRFEWSAPYLAASLGSTFWLQRPHHQVEQPLGTLSPYSAAPVRTDSTSFLSAFSTGQSGTFAQFTVHPFRPFELSAGARLQTFAMGGHSTLTPRLNLRFDANEHVSFHLGFASYAQLPPYIYLLSYPQNRALLPMRATHLIIGLDLNPGLSSQIHIEAYNKSYSNIPASTEYPTINLHNLVEMLGQQIVWIPMNSRGRGQSSGIEISDLTRIKSKLVVRASVAYARAMFAGIDGIRRSSNYDLPWMLNAAVLQSLGRGYEIASRFGFASGRPYTPFDLSHSIAQNRPIYDTSRMNSQRAPAFARWDIQLNKDFLLRGAHMELYLGANNILNRDNFLSYVWLSDTRIAKVHIDPVFRLNQMPVFPNVGLRYIFR
jgi:hypothetical protein